MNGPTTTLRRLRIARIHRADGSYLDDNGMARVLNARILDLAGNDMSGTT
jgi:hypothetical protein